VIVVTAASSNHFGALRYMLESLRAYWSSPGADAARPR